MKKLIRHIEVNGQMVVETGLRIGAGGSSLEIGGLDNPILRHPVTRLPYVPGSSIKGKMRSLLESYASFPWDPKPQPVAKFDRDKNPLGNGPCECGNCLVCCCFGCGKPERAKEPSRLIFRDCQIVEDSVKTLEPLLSEGVFYSEVKAEVTMDRSSGKVGQAGPRTMDRIAAGTVLDFRISIRVFEGDDVQIMKAALAEGLKLIMAEGLGGSITRGYGQVRFENLTWDGQPWNLQGPKGDA